MRTKPFTVIQNGKPLFIIHAYSLEQARALVAAKVAGETIIVGPVSLNAQTSDPRHQERHSGNGLCLSDAKVDQARHGT